MLRLTDRLGAELSKDGRAGHAAGSRSWGGSGFDFHLFAQTPELKSFYIDCFFDLIAGEVMGRGLVRPDHPRNSPGTWFCGSLLPIGSPAKARNSFLVSDLKM